MWGVLGPQQSVGKMSVLGYVNEGGTLNTPGMLFVNTCSWAHCVAEVANVLGVPAERFLSAQELEALKGQRNPHGVIVPAAGA
jgi:phosphoketolase